MLFAQGDPAWVGVLMVGVLAVAGWNIWKIVARPDIYKAELEDKRHRREQRNKLLGPAAGLGMRMLGRALDRRKW